jgi:hypothetical protein
MGALIRFLPALGKGLKNSLPKVFQAIGIGTTGAVISNTADSIPNLPDPATPGGQNKLFLWGFIALFLLLILKK